MDICLIAIEELGMSCQDCIHYSEELECIAEPDEFFETESKKGE